MSDLATITERYHAAGWRPLERVAFRIAFVFFGLLIVPLDWSYWRQLATTDWSQFQDLFRLTTYSPEFIAVPKWGLASYGNWGLALLVAIAVGIVWSARDRRRREYDDLYYWFRAALRYRLALSAIAYGVLMALDLLFPAPTLSDLNTNYADFLPWKIYYLTLGVASARYEESLGIISLAGGLLLLARPTAVIGAGIVSAMLVNIVAVAFAYQTGDHVHASLLLLIATVLLAHDLPRLYDLLVRERPAVADSYQPVFAAGWPARARRLLKGAVVVFAVVLGGEALHAGRGGEWRFSDQPGLPGAEGLYNVKEFAINGRTLPYSLVDPVRWQNVVFERWNTVSIRVHRPVAINLATPSIAPASADRRNYEMAGNGGRHFYRYTATGDGRLTLQGRNDPAESYAFTCVRDGDHQLRLSGTDAAGNTLAIQLEKVDKVYLLNEGRRRPLTIY